MAGNPVIVSSAGAIAQYPHPDGVAHYTISIPYFVDGGNFVPITPQIRVSPDTLLLEVEMVPTLTMVIVYLDLRPPSLSPATQDDSGFIPDERQLSRT